LKCTFQGENTKNPDFRGGNKTNSAPFNHAKLNHAMALRKWLFVQPHIHYRPPSECGRRQAGKSLHFDLLEAYAWGKEFELGRFSSRFAQPLALHFFSVRI